MRRNHLVLFLCMSRLAAADEAEGLFQDAKRELQQSCQPRACPGFAGPAGKLKRAYLLRADERFASTYCDYARMAKRAPAEEGDILVMCDLAELAGDYPKELRERRVKAGRSSSPAAAARALYGDGLTLGQTEGPKPVTTLAWGTITADGMQELIRDHYVGVIETSDVLKDPRRKLDACKRIAATIPDAKERKATTELCEWAGARDANAPYLAFGGATGLDKIKLENNAPVFQLDAKLRYQPMFVLASNKRIDKPWSLADQRDLLDAIITQGEQHAHYKDAVARRAEIEAYIKRRTAEGEVTMRQINARTSQVAFLPYAPQQWDVPAPVSGHAATCANLAAVAPAIGKASGDTELLLKVDGKTCSDSYSLVAAPSDECAELLTDGRHKIDAELFRVSWKKTGEKQVTIHSKDTVDIRDKEAASRGARVARGTITCGAAR